MSDKFCPLPWNSINTRNNGQCRVCCNANSYTQNKGIISDENNVPYNAGTANFDNVRNSNLLKEIRIKMLNNEWHEECTRCKNEESAGIRSRRQFENDNYPELKEIALNNTASDGTIDIKKVPIQYLDIRYGNFCNLKCRMCGATDSHSWIQDLHKLGIKKYNETDRQVNIISNGAGRATIDYEYDWYSSSETFNTQVLDNLKNIKKIYVVGGEPLYIDEHYTFLELISNTEHAKNVYIEYNTNLTNIPKNIIPLWKKFKGVLIGVSIDGYGKVLEYQRYPANWDQLYKNLIKINNFVNEGLPIRYDLPVSKDQYSSAAWLAFTVTPLNVFHFPEFIKWKIEESGLDAFGVTSKPIVNYHMCHSPAHYNIKNMPNDLKKLVEDRYLKFLDYSKNNYNVNYHKHIEKMLVSIIKFMCSSSGNEKHWNDFIDHTLKLDSIRNQSIAESIPEYKETFYAYKK
jgi:hypothetical protein